MIHSHTVQGDELGWPSTSSALTNRASLEAFEAGSSQKSPSTLSRAARAQKSFGSIQNQQKQNKNQDYNIA